MKRFLFSVTDYRGVCCIVRIIYIPDSGIFFACFWMIFGALLGGRERIKAGIVYFPPKNILVSLFGAIFGDEKGLKLDVSNSHSWIFVRSPCLLLNDLSAFVGQFLKSGHDAIAAVCAVMIPLVSFGAGVRVRPYISCWRTFHVKMTSLVLVVV